jgi:hypothetical protein
LIKRTKLSLPLLLIFSTNVFASWDGILAGKINAIDVAPGQNYGFRVSLINAPKLCGNNHTWAYLNESDSNYQTFVSVLLAAKMADKQVTLYTKIESTSGHDYCHIGYISLR